jgi:hypothetical protein
MSVLYTLSSCTRSIPKEKLTIIDNMVLGSTKEDFNKQFEELKIPSKTILSNWLSISDKEFENNKITCHYTNFFNFDEFINKSQNLEHLGLFYPETFNNKNITSLTILLGHTGKAITNDSTQNFQYFRQDVIKTLIEKIKNLYVLKYGKPEYLFDTLMENNYYLLKNNSISVNSIESPKHFTCIWKTDYFNVILFSGADFRAYYRKTNGYTTSSNYLYSNTSNNPLPFDAYECFSVPYIKYELNDRAIKELRLNINNL